MNGNNAGKKKGNGCLTAIIWAAVILIFSADILGEISPSLLGLLLIFAVPIIIVVLVARSEKRKVAAARQQTPQYRPAPSQQQYNAPVREYYDSDCMQADTGHDHDRRAEQLEAFLKNGLIDKEEYEMMKSRYERMGYGR